MKIDIYTIVVFVRKKLYLVFNAFYFKKISFKTSIISPLKIDGKKHIVLDKNVVIQHKTWLAAKPINGNANCELEIGEGTAIGHYNHIYATKSIKIGKHVLTADKVYIADNSHGFEDINTPIKYQPIVQLNEVVIGDGTWIGENVCIIGVKIGKNCVIGANSVILKDIPDYCVAVGTPGRIVKRYCIESNTWNKTNADGSFK